MSSGNAWSWPNGDPVDHGLAESIGTGSRLVINISDLNLHAANPANIAGPQCESGNNRKNESSGQYELRRFLCQTPLMPYFKFKFVMHFTTILNVHTPVTREK